MNVVRSFRLWCVALVAVVTLVIATAPSVPTPVARIAHLESLVRCPACEDISVAQSNATAAIAIRHEIVGKVRRGQSDSQILTSLEATYGTSILLSPSTSGLGALLWIVPIAGLVIAVVTGLRLARRR